MSIAILRQSGCAGLFFLAVSSAHADTVQQIFKNLDLLGTWSADCTKPASPQNPYIVHRPLGAEGVQRGTTINPASQPSLLFVVDQAATKPNEISFSFKDAAANRVNFVVRVERKRMRAMERVLDNGQKTILDGRQTANGRDTPWFNKCD